MKKLLRIVIISLILGAILSISANGEDLIFDDYGKEIWNAIPEDAKKYIEEEKIVGSANDKYPNLEVFDAEVIMQAAADSVNETYNSVFPDFLGLLSIIAAASLINVMKSNFEKSNISGLIEFISVTCITVSSYDIVYGMWDKLLTSMKMMSASMSAMLPIMTGLYAASGSVTSAAVSDVNLSVILNIIESITTSLMPPLLGVTFGLAVMSELVGNYGKGIGGLAGTVTKIFSFITGAVMLIFSAALAFQTSIAQSADNMLARSAKFAVSSMIPVVGGAIGDASRNVIESISYIKSTAGGVAAFSILISAIPPFITVLLCKLGFSVSAEGAKLVGCEREGRLLSSISEIVGFCLAILCLSSTVFILAIGIFIKGGSKI